VAFITSMDQPLGREVGNACEIRESIDVLRGGGPKDIVELTLTLGEAMLELGGIEGGRDRLLETLHSGAALEKFVEVVAAHGGEPEAIADPDRLPTAPHRTMLTAPTDGYVARCDALTIGIAATRLGAGRERKEDTVDPGVGITLHAKIGDQVTEGDPLATVAYSDPARWEAQRAALAGAWEIIADPTEPPELVLERIDSSAI
jgi:thymidine phosphorylase